ncbi:MAG: helix-turn-helix transcriptional regulator [Xanthomonadales bacterium]|nr:helix-turn-helix transcriptional regulator [Xanthomonadales bacterium]
MIEKAFRHQYKGAILRSSRILPARKFVETDIYHSLFKPLGMKHAAGITMDIGAGSMTHYSFIKPHDAPDFTDRELDVLRDLQPDLTQVWLGFQHLSGLQAQLDMLTTLWDRFDHPVVVTDKQRKVRFANRAAEHLFESNSLFVSRLGKLRGASAGVEARLQRAFSQLDDDRRQIISLAPQTAGKADRPTATLFRMSSNRVALVVTHPTASGTDFRPMLQQCYQMTASEADVVQFILSGHSLRDYCNSHTATYETARTHLKNAMKKNGWRRQGEMIAAVLSALLPAGSFQTDRPLRPG